MRTPLQQYRQAMAEGGLELTLAEAQESRRRCFAAIRRAMMKVDRRCPNDDDAMQGWLYPSDMEFVIETQCRVTLAFRSGD